MMGSHTLLMLQYNFCIIRTLKKSSLGTEVESMPLHTPEQGVPIPGVYVCLIRTASRAYRRHVIVHGGGFDG
jgi:hypothetical protein